MSDSSPSETSPASPSASSLSEFAVDGITPSHVVRPGSQAALAEVLADATRDERGVILQGGRTQIGVGNAPQHYDLAIDLRSLDQIVDLQPEDFTVTVQAGMTVSALQQTLWEHGQFVPLDVPLVERSTVGGLVARGRGGVRRARFGSVRDWLIGCEMLLADGTAIKGGGRVVKNVSGFDLPKLFAGSWGTLGCLTQITFKLRPIPVDDATLLIPCTDIHHALELGTRLSLSTAGIEAAAALDAESAQRCASDPATTAATDTALLAIRLSGVREAVDETLLNLRRHASTARTPAATDPAFWQQIVDLEIPAPLSAPANNDPVRVEPTLLRIGVRPSRLATIARELSDLAPNVRLWSYVDSGILFAELPLLSVDGTITVIETLRSRLADEQGAVTVESAAADVKAAIDVWGSAGEGIAIMRELKQQFDPGAILSRGRFVGGI